MVKFSSFSLFFFTFKGWGTCKTPPNKPAVVQDVLTQAMTTIDPYYAT